MTTSGDGQQPVAEGPEPGADREGVLLLMPRDARSATGPLSVWLTAAGWAEAAARLRGHSWLVTPSGVLSPADARDLATSATKPGRPRRGWKKMLPKFLATLRSDLRSWQHQRRFAASMLEGPWSDAEVAWVWQHHEIFNTSGFRAAERYRCPVVLFVDAPVVWEGRQWGAHRPGWGRLVERIGERPAFRQADVVACVTEEVAHEVVRLGADPARVMVTPCAVDLERFNPDVSSDQARIALGLTDELAIGWVGTFHAFHGLDLLVDAFAALAPDYPNARLVLLGDGQDRPRVAARIEELGLDSVLLPGAVPQSDVPSYLAAMDICTVVDPGSGDFHYSPLKVKEYLACGRATVVPRSGQIARDLTDGETVLMVPPGDVDAIAQALRRLLEDPELRRELGRAGAAHIASTGTWTHQVQRVADKLAGA